MTNASTSFLVDTNILVYAYAPQDIVKQEQSIQLLDDLIQREVAVLSTQCLSEFYNVVTNRLAQRLSPTEALTQVTRLSESCKVLSMTSGIILEGCRGAVEHQLSIWDALIWATAKLNQVPFIITEDSDYDRVLEGIHYLNPFSPAFDLQFR